MMVFSLFYYWVIFYRRSMAPGERTNERLSIGRTCFCIIREKRKKEPIRNYFNRLLPSSFLLTDKTKKQKFPVLPVYYDFTLFKPLLKKLKFFEHKIYLFLPLSYRRYLLFVPPISSFWILPWNGASPSSFFSFVLHSHLFPFSFFSMMITQQLLG